MIFKQFSNKTETKDAYNDPVSLREASEKEIVHMESQERVEVNSVTYSADAQREMDAIVAKYVKQDAPKQETALDRMQKLDRAAESKAQIVGLAVGIVAALVLGLGMSCALVWGQLAIGILVGLIGLAGVIAAYPLYQRALRQEREKIAPEIIRLSEEK